jgi:hypothetical protein
MEELTTARPSVLHTSFFVEKFFLPNLRCAFIDLDPMTVLQGIGMIASTAPDF